MIIVCTCTILQFENDWKNRAFFFLNIFFYGGAYFPMISLVGEDEFSKFGDERTKEQSMVIAGSNSGSAS